MADEEMIPGNGATALAELPLEGTPPADDGKKKRKKKDDDDLEYEVEFATPFGKLEFEFEPSSKKEKKDRERKAKAERVAAQRKAAELAKRAEREASRGGGGRLLLTLVIVGALVAAVIAAYWLFARPDEDEDAIPPEFANEPQPAPQGFVARAKSRLGDAVRAGRRASREAQKEQREKFERMTGGV
jgi:hypothetical protein